MLQQYTLMTTHLDVIIQAFLQCPHALDLHAYLVKVLIALTGEVMTPAQNTPMVATSSRCRLADDPEIEAASWHTVCHMAGRGMPAALDAAQVAAPKAPAMEGCLPADDLLYKGAAHHWLDGWLLAGADEVLVNAILQGTASHSTQRSTHARQPAVMHP
jgi:hypothetical protein